jgi:hypothetical protein
MPQPLKFCNLHGLYGKATDIPATSGKIFN